MHFHLFLYISIFLNSIDKIRPENVRIDAKNKKDRNILII